MLVVDGVSFSFRLDGTSTPGRFHIHKSGAMLDRYLELVDQMHGCNVVELGIHLGGSAALAAVRGQPRRLTVVDIGGPVPALDELIRDRGLRHVRALYGTDQADPVIADVAGPGIDLVIDDASHEHGPTCASFELLFPLLRPGGRYLIEDWDWELVLFRRFAEKARADPDWGRELIRQVADPSHPSHEAAGAVLSRLPPEAAELLDGYTPPPSDHRSLASLIGDLAATHSARPDVVASMTIGRGWITVERGPAELASPCSIAALCGWSRYAH